MVLTYLSLHKIKFPVYPIPEGLIDRADGLLYIDDRILDDTNMSGATLGRRRLQTHTALEDLVPLNKQIVNIAGLMKNPGNRRYIDDEGRFFIYRKTKFEKIRYHKIKKVEKKETKSVLWVKGVKSAFTLVRPPEADKHWVGILYLRGFPWIVYEFAGDSKPEARKKI